jgi:DNA-binding NarL/FixJ family response regulator
MAAKKSVVIIDDHPVFREGVKALVGGQTDYNIVAEAGDARQALEVVLKTKPDIAIIDLSLPDRSGLELIREIRGRLHATRILVLSMHSKADYIASAFQSGATGYVVKESASENLLAALDAVSRGDYFMDSAVAGQVVKKLMRNQPEASKTIPDSKYDTLTDREQEILTLLAEGLGIKEIAEKLFISQKTVENHRSKIYSKLDVHSSIELVRFAAKIGIIDVDLWK